MPITWGIAVLNVVLENNEKASYNKLVNSPIVKFAWRSIALNVPCGISPVWTGTVIGRCIPGLYKTA